MLPYPYADPANIKPDRSFFVPSRITVNLQNRAAHTEISTTRFFNQAQVVLPELRSKEQIHAIMLPSWLDDIAALVREKEDTCSAPAVRAIVRSVYQHLGCWLTGEFQPR